MRGSSQNGVTTNGRVHYWRFNWKLGDPVSEIGVRYNHLSCKDYKKSEIDTNIWKITPQEFSSPYPSKKTNIFYQY